MYIKIYQVDMDRDKNNVLFMRFDSLEKYQGSSKVQSDIYNKVFEGDVDCKSLEDIYQKFNRNHPLDYCGHSLSVSDVVEICDVSDIPELVGRIRFYNSPTTFEEVSYTDMNKFKADIYEAQDVGRTIEVDELSGKHISVVEKGFYYCDSIGFKKIDFEPELTSRVPDTMKIVLLEPDKKAKITEIGSNLRHMQYVVGGSIEKAHQLDDGVCLICNEEGKINGMDFNRAVYDDKHKVIDVIQGPCFICGFTNEDFIGLTDEQANRYAEKFKFPEKFYKVSGRDNSVEFVAVKQSLNDVIASCAAKSNAAQESIKKSTIDMQKNDELNL